MSQRRQSCREGQNYTAALMSIVTAEKVSFTLQVFPANGDVTLAKSIAEWALFGEQMSSFPLCGRVLEDVLIAERASTI